MDGSDVGPQHVAPSRATPGRVQSHCAGGARLPLVTTITRPFRAAARSEHLAEGDALRGVGPDPCAHHQGALTPLLPPPAAPRPPRQAGERAVHAFQAEGAGARESVWTRRERRTSARVWGVGACVACAYTTQARLSMRDAVQQ